MLKRVVVAIDGLTDEQRQRIASQVDGWAIVDFISERPDNWADALAQAEVMLGWPPPQAIAQSEVRFFQLPSSGYEQYLSEALPTKPRFRLANARGVAAVAVAEHCLSMMFAFTRQVALHAQQQARRQWQRATHYALLAGSTVAIVGMGAVGRALAQRCHALGMNVIGVQRGPDAPAYVAEVYALEQLHAALRKARHVALAIAALPRSEPLFGAMEFHAMPKGSYFYNLARGSLVDESAIEAALREGRLAGAGLDVFLHEPLPETSSLWDLDGVLVSPHSGGRFDDELDGLIDLFLHNLQQYRDGKPMKNLVIDTTS
jgi:phosphoglycerate dehydrogenase-like enzyme